MRRLKLCEVCQYRGIRSTMNFWTGATASSGVAVLVDQTTTITNYFSSMRLPATFLATQALNSLFHLERARDEVGQDVEKILTSATQFLVLLAFMTAVSSVVSGTAAGVKILHGGFDPMASTPYQLLLRDFEFEYLSCRLNFIVSIFSFLVGTGAQSIVQFNLLKPGREKVLILFVATVMSITTYLISYFNSHVYDYGSLLGMSSDFVRLIFVRIPKVEPLIIMFVASTAVTAVLLIQLILMPILKFLAPSDADNGRRSRMSP